VTSPSPSADLSKLRINRDAPPPEVRRALTRNVALAVVALLLILGGFFFMRGGGAVPVQVVTIAAASGSDGGGSAGPGTSVTANGYVVARTRASVSAKLAGRIADLRVSEGSTPGLLLSGIVFAVVMGLVGGFFPARRAARQPVVQALR